MALKDYLDLSGLQHFLEKLPELFATKNEVPSNLQNGNSAGSVRGVNSSAESSSYVMGENAFAVGNGTKALGKNSFTSGKYNVVDDTGLYATIVGNGDADTNRKNIHTLDWQGNAWFNGDVYIGSTSGINKDEGSKKLATEEFALSAVSSDMENYFFIVETVKQGANYHFDGITFDEIVEKFNNGGNMVCHIDGTDYIPLLSVTSSKIIFSGIYNTTSVSLDFDTDGVGVLTTTHLVDNVRLSNYYTRTETDTQIATLKSDIPVLTAASDTDIDALFA